MYHRDQPEWRCTIRTSHGIRRASIKGVMKLVRRMIDRRTGAIYLRELGWTWKSELVRALD